MRGAAGQATSAEPIRKSDLGLLKPRMDSAIAQARGPASSSSSSSSSASASGLSSLWGEVKDAFFSPKAIKYRVVAPTTGRTSLIQPCEGVRKLDRGETLSQVQRKAWGALSQAMTGRDPAASVTEGTIGEYVKVCLGMTYDKNKVSVEFGEQAKKLSKNASSWDFARQSVPRSAVQLLSALYIHQRGENAFLEQTAPRTDAGEQFAQFIVSHTGLDLGEVKAAINKNYLRDVIVERGQQGAVTVEIFGRKRPLALFHSDQKAVLAETRTKLSKAVVDYVEVVREWVRTSEKPAADNAAPVRRAVPLPVDRKGKGKADDEVDFAGRAEADFEIQMEPHPDDVEDTPLARAPEVSTSAGQAAPGPIDPAVHWEHLEGSTARALWQIPSTEDLKTYPSAELRRALYQLPNDQDFELALSGLAADQLAVLATAAPATRALDFDEANAKRKAKIDHRLHERTVTLLSSLTGTLHDVGEGYGDAEIGAVLAPFLAGGQNLGWLASAIAGRGSWIDRNSLRGVGLRLCQAISENAQSLSRDEARKLLKVLDELAPLESSAVSEEEKSLEELGTPPRKFAEARYAARDSLFDRCVSLTRKAAKAGNEVSSGFEVDRALDHVAAFEPIKEMLKKALGRKEGVTETETEGDTEGEAPVVINVTLGNGRQAENVPIPQNFFREIGPLLANSPDGVVIGGINVGALIGQHYRGRIEAPLPSTNGRIALSPYQNDARAIEVLLHILARFCRTREEMGALAALLTQTSLYAANAYYKSMASQVVTGRSDDDDVLTQVNAVDAGKRVRVDRRGDGTIEVRPIFDVRFKAPAYEPDRFDAEDSSGVVLPMFQISGRGKEIKLAQVEHYSIFSKNAAQPRREQVSLKAGKN